MCKSAFWRLKSVNEKCNSWLRPRRIFLFVHFAVAKRARCPLALAFARFRVVFYLRLLLSTLRFAVRRLQFCGGVRDRRALHFSVAAAVPRAFARSLVCARPLAHLRWPLGGLVVRRRRRQLAPALIRRRAPSSRLSVTFATPIL